MRTGPCATAGRRLVRIGLCWHTITKTTFRVKLDKGTRTRSRGLSPLVCYVCRAHVALHLQACSIYEYSPTLTQGKMYYHKCHAFLTGSETRIMNPIIPCTSDRDVRFSQVAYVKYGRIIPVTTSCIFLEQLITLFASGSYPERGNPFLL